MECLSITVLQPQGCRRPAVDDPAKSHAQFPGAVFWGSVWIRRSPTCDSFYSCGNYGDVRKSNELRKPSQKGTGKQRCKELSNIEKILDNAEKPEFKPEKKNIRENRMDERSLIDENLSLKAFPKMSAGSCIPYAADPSACW